MAMKFYMTPGSCSTGIHILLEEIGLPFEAWIVNLPAGEHRQPGYLAINPKGTIPTLVRDDGSALTDFQAIAYWLARSHPRRKLLSEDLEEQVRAIELMDYAVGTIHGQGFTRIFVADSYAPNPADHPAVVERGREIVREAFAVVDAALAGRDWASGAHFGIADAALFYVEFWAERLQMALPPNCRAHYERVRARPAVQQVLREEGYR